MLLIFFYLACSSCSFAVWILYWLLSVLIGFLILFRCILFLHNIVYCLLVKLVLGLYIMVFLNCSLFLLCWFHHITCCIEVMCNFHASHFCCIITISFVKRIGTLYDALINVRLLLLLLVRGLPQKNYKAIAFCLQLSTPNVDYWLMLYALKPVTCTSRQDIPFDMIHHICFLIAHKSTGATLC